MNKKKALVLINLGTPDKPRKKEVRRYLTEFLNDRRVIDIPWLAQKLLVNLIIIPFRVGNSTKLYERLWTEDGSPLLIYLNNLAAKMQLRLDGQYEVFGAMRYGKPSLTGVLNRIKKEQFEEVIFFPLFPQYASSTSGSIVEKVLREMKSWEAIPSVKMINQFHNHPDFIHAFAKNISAYEPGQYDHVVFSYHGLPYRQINKIHPQKDGESCECDQEMPADGTLCYKATCYETTRLLAQKLDLPKSKYSVGFQSRLSKNWLSPFTDELITDLAKKGAKKVLITAPSFVADCLETIVELEYEYKELFLENGGKQLTLVKSLNDSDHWAEAIEKMI
ncbi:MAG: ferrochelatase [Bacteroidales bacterium]|nr:ferrochelatase [Bacteroidales bacterium]